MEYKDFFRHIEEKVQKQNRLRKVSKKLSERLEISQVEALSKIQDRPMLREWMEVEKQASSTSETIQRLKDKANAPSVGDTVEVRFDEEARGHLTPQQKEINGKKGIVEVRDAFSKGSQRARYTVEVTGEDGQPFKIHNLTPGEVIPT